MKAEYRKARRYAWRLNPYLCTDLVHDAYLAERRKGRDLFTYPLPLIFRIIRYTYYDFLKHLHGQGEIRYSTEIYADDLLMNEITPDLELEGKELKALLDSVPDKSGVIHDILELKYRGYPNKEIADILHVHKTLIGYYLKQVMAQLTNPINGSKLKITKQISLASWEKKTDKEDYELDDENEFYMVFRHKESKDGLLVKLPSAKTNPYIK